MSLILVVSLAGCSALGDEPTRDERAVEALEDARTVLDETSTYRYEGELSVAADRQRIDGSVFGAVDLANETLYTNATIDGTTLESYLEGETRREQCPPPWDGWNVESLDEDEGDPWPDDTPAHSQLSLFEDGDLYWNGTEAYDGREAIRLTGSPPADAFDDSGLSSSRFDFGGPNLEDAHTTLWLDAETGRPLETSVEFDVSGDGETATVSITMRYSAYDEPVSIDVPTVPSDQRYELGCPGT
ncbi:LolA-like protein [Halopiger thermotolerans]